MRTLLFVGFGAGLQDPNFAAFLRWTTHVFPGSEYRHFRLVRTHEVNEIQRQHPRDERIFALTYGTDFGDLAPFLQCLAPSMNLPAPTVAALQQLSQGQLRIDERRAELEATKVALGPAEYLRRLSDIAFEEWELGGKRRAWWSLGGPFQRDASSIEKDERIAIGTKLAQMMIDDNEPRSAAHILQLLQTDVAALANSDPNKLAFWRAQSRCWLDLGAYDEAVTAINEGMGLAADEATKQRLQADLAELHLLQGEVEKAMDSSTTTE
jgi:hypothetical protein